MANIMFAISNVISIFAILKEYTNTPKRKYLHTISNIIELSCQIYITTISYKRVFT